MPKPLITLLTDFGTADGYVGAVKGVIRDMAPNVEIMDISHDIPPFDIAAGALSLNTFYNYFPRGTVHLAVVDPGVGSTRNALIIRTARYYFVGPDNGLFHWILKNEAHTLFAVDTDRFLKETTHHTFHARDLFGPVAALLALGKAPENLGRPLPERTEHARSLFTRIKDGVYRVPVYHIDRFGNIIFAFQKEDLARLQSKHIRRVSFKGRHWKALARYYDQQEPGAPLVLWNSSDFLEIALNRGDAARFFDVRLRKDYLDLELET